MFDIFSDAGLNKLKLLKANVIDLNNKQYNPDESSAYSQRMVTTVIIMIDTLMFNNDNSYWSDNDNIAKFKALIEILDYKTGTNVPEVFNLQSLELAETLIRTLETLDFNQDFETVASAFINTLTGNPENFLKLMIENLNNKITLYKMFAENAKHGLRDNVNDLRLRIDNEMLLWTKNPKDLLNDLDNNKATYTAMVQELMQKIAEIPHYTRLANTKNFVNTSEPYRLIGDEVTAVGLRFPRIEQLLKLEMDLAKEFQALGQKPWLVAHSAYYAACSADNMSAINTRLQQTFVQLMGALRKYKNGDHFMAGGFSVSGLFRSFKGVNKDKIRCVDELIATLHTINATKEDDYTPGIRSFKIFQAMMNAARSNERVSASAEISLGELSKLLGTHAWNFFNITCNGVNQTNDGYVQHLIKNNLKFDLKAKYGDVSLLDLPPVAATPALTV